MRDRLAWLSSSEGLLETRRSQVADLKRAFLRAETNSERRALAAKIDSLEHELSGSAAQSDRAIEASLGRPAAPMEVAITVGPRHVELRDTETWAIANEARSIDDLDLYVINVLAELLSNLGSGIEQTPTLSPLSYAQALGSLLYRTIFTGSVKNSFELMLDRSDRARPLRVSLRFGEESNGLNRLPWEFLYVPGSNNGRGAFLATEPQLTLVRSTVIHTRPQEHQPTELPLRVLVAQFDETHMPDSSSVFHELLRRGAGDLSGVILSGALEPDGRVSTAALLNAPHVLHIHGRFRFDPHGTSFWWTGDGEPRWIGVSEMFDRIMRGISPPPLVVLTPARSTDERLPIDTGSSAAMLEAGEELLRAGVRAVLTVDRENSDSLADLLLTIYRLVADSEPLDVAVQRARTDLRLRGLNVLAFVLHLQAVADASLRLVSAPNRPVSLDASVPASRHQPVARTLLRLIDAVGEGSAAADLRDWVRRQAWPDDYAQVVDLLQARRRKDFDDVDKRRLLALMISEIRDLQGADPA